MVYQDCDIGSAKPNKDILRKHPHQMINVVNLNTIFTVADFYSISHKLIEKAHLKNKLPVFVGGSMMYFNSLYKGIHNLPKRDEDYRNELEVLKIENESNYLYKLLENIDPIYAKDVNQNDDIRIIRALEVYKATGKPLSKILSDEPKNNLSDQYQVHQFGILDERDKFHQRIEIRLNRSLNKGRSRLNCTAKDQNGHWVLSDKAAKLAGDEATMTHALPGQLSHIEGLSKITGMRAFFPFIRTGFNSLGLAFQHTELVKFTNNDSNYQGW